jgi:hypothetical protein
MYALWYNIGYVYKYPEILNKISGVMVSMLASSAVDHGLVPGLGQTKDNKICICCFSTISTQH